jgi:branched-chain amino acid aminotransferase
MSTITTIKIPALPGKKSKILRLANPTTSLDDASRQLPGGVYTTFRTYQKRYAISLLDHFDRLENSARLSGIVISLDYERLRLELRNALSLFDPAEARVRVSVDLTVNPGDVYLSLEELRTPSVVQYRDGVAVITRKMHRENPVAKATNFILEAEKVRHEVDFQEINEVLMVSEDDHVLEGLSSNFFGIQNETLITAEEGILPGITRKMVIEIAHQLGYFVAYRNIRLGELSRLDEAFITSASRAILPVTRINNQTVGTGKVGNITRELQVAFQKNLDASLDLI